MPVRFGPSGAYPKSREVLQYRLGVELFVLVGSDRTYDAETPLHWIGEQERTVPCTREECPWCVRQIPSRVTWYLPCLLYTWQTRVWDEKILPIHWGMRGFLDLPREKTVYSFGRVGYKNAPVRWKVHPEHKISQPFPGFDVTESVLNMWGMFSKARRTNDRLGEAPRLFDEPDGPSEVA